MASLHCNKCYEAFDSGGVSKAVSTSCGHLFCSNCSEACFPVLGKDGGHIAQCPVCDETLMKSNLKVVPVLANATDIKMALFGQAPEAIMQTALAAINFYTVQQQVVSNFRETRLADTAIHMKEQCNKKLAEVHSAYQNAKRKYQTIVQEKAGLEQETRELQDKYRQKSKQNQELQRMYKELQIRNDSMRRGGSGAVAGGNGAMNMGNMSPMMSNHSNGSGGGGGAQMVTTVHRTQLYNLGGLSPQLGGQLTMGDDLNGGKGSGRRQAMLPLGPGMGSSPGNVGVNAQVMSQRREMLHLLPGRPTGNQPAKLLPGGNIGQSRRGFS